MSSIQAICKSARTAGQSLAALDSHTRNSALEAIARAIDSKRDAIISANASDLSAAAACGTSDAVVKRLVLDNAKLDSLLKGIHDVVALSDPLGVRTLHRELSDGLVLQRITCPIGVICIIFESRPEAVVQIASLVIKSGNAVILKGGKEAFHSNSILVSVIREALSGCAGFPVDAVNLVSTREEIADLLQLDEYIDLVIPRGSNKLVKDIKAATRIPVMGHADGICSIFVDKAADLKKAAPLIVDSKTNYPAACNAVERIFIHDALLPVIAQIVGPLLQAGVNLHCDASTLGGATTAACELGDKFKAQVFSAAPEDFAKEWLSFDVTVIAVESLKAAVDEINSSGSHHTDCIITEDDAAVAQFIARVDSAGVYHNASTRFADGFRYGFGAEVGISTNRIHARGPVGLDGLLTYKYLLQGSGHCVGQFSGSSKEVSIGGASMKAASYTHKDL